MTIKLTTVLHALPERVWHEVLTPKLLQFVAAPLVHFIPLQPPSFPENWGNGRYLAEVRIFGWLPFGTQWIVTSIESEDNEQGRQVYTLRDNGHSHLISTWDHWIFIEELPNGFTRYTDRIEVRAGILTPFIGIFAWIFYWHRQRRWRLFVKRGFQYQ
ncbi:MAG: hypothetical protein H9535_05580 [Ignavibacteria bacterium]|jgi:hypothetical protein|nr:hypothetical protein [Ignavibacteria bacterium]